MQRGFKTTSIHDDSKFEQICVEMTNIGISLNFASKKERVPDIEQFNWAVKEHVRSSW